MAPRAKAPFPPEPDSDAPARPGTASASCAEGSDSSALAAGFAAEMARCLPDPPAALGVALSGGGDSVALLHLITEWAAPRGIAVEAFTFDHALRAASAEEAAFCAALCTGLGVTHAVERWEGPGRGNLQAAARNARHAALLGWAGARGLGAVALGHTEDDQAETLLLRLARGSGVDGLSCMAGREERAGLLLLRPLLQMRRAALREWLSARGLAWCDDPSNLDQRFARVRARAALEALAPLGLDAPRLAKTAERMRLAREALEEATAAHARAVCTLSEAGEMTLSPGWDDAPLELSERLLSAALCAIGGQAYRPRLPALRAARLALGKGRRATLHGCLLRPGRSGALRITREEAACPPWQHDLSLPWDGRWHLEGPQLRADESVGALGMEGLAGLPGWRDTGHSSAALAASPAIRAGRRIIAAPLALPGGNWQARLFLPRPGGGARAIFD